MSLYSLPFTFARRELPVDEAEYVVLGVPYDSSSSFKAGSREAPLAIRRASQEIEDFDLLEGFNLLDLKIADAGDIEPSYGSAEITKERVEFTVGEILSRGAKPVILGGEHTISSFVLEAFSEDVFFLCLDAHLDFRDEYLGNRYSHACTLRRVADKLGYENVLAVGVRSACKEELEDAERLGVRFIPVTGFENVKALSARLKKEISGKKVYLSVDMDFFDPKEARGVGNPEPPGVFFSDFLQMLDFLSESELVGMDVTEVVPALDSYTPVLAAKVVLKVLARHEKFRQNYRGYSASL